MNLKTYLNCAYCGNRLAWRWRWSWHWHRLIEGACPCKVEAAFKPIDVSIAKQLQRSIERNARMMNALKAAKNQLTIMGDALSQATGGDERFANTTDFYNAMKRIDDAIHNSQKDSAR